MRSKGTTSASEALRQRRQWRAAAYVSTIVVVLAISSSGAAEADVAAKWWFSNPVYRLNDNRRVILFFFETTQRESADYARRLRDISRRPDVLVIGLTADSRTAAERFISQNRIPFTVGAGSRSAKQFGVEKFPAILIISRGTKTAPRSVEIDELSRSLPPWRENWQELDDEESLRAYVLSDASGGSRAAALQRLYEVLGADRRSEIIDLAAERLAEEPDPTVRARLRYYRDLAQGIPRADAEPTQSARSYREYRQNPNDPKWAPVKAFQAQLSRANPEDLRLHYDQHTGGAPSDVLVRRLAVFELAKGATDRQSDQTYRSQVRRSLLDILPREPDASIRMLAAIGLAKACEVGDQEAIAYLEALSQTDPDDFRVRPTLERAAQQIRTGTTTAPSSSTSP